MKIKYFGNSWETGLTLTAKIYDHNGQVVGTGHALTETALNSGIYISAEINNSNGNLPKGVYVSVVTDTEGVRRGYDEFGWNGIKEVSLDDINFWSKQEQAEIRDALGVSGDKSVAMEGQLQKKSESPYNNTIDTNKLN